MRSGIFTRSVIFCLVGRVIFCELNPQVSAELCSTCHWKFPQVFENDQAVHFESHKKSALPFPLMTQLQTFWLQVNRDATIAWMHVLIWLGTEGPMTHLLSMFSSSAWWRGNCSSSSPIHVILYSWFNSMANTWRKFSKVQTIQHYAVGHLTRTHNSVRCVAHNYPLSARTTDSTWLTAHLLRFSPRNPVCYCLRVSNVLARISQPSCKQPYPTKCSHHTQEAWLMNILDRMSFRPGKNTHSLLLCHVTYSTIAINP